MAAPREDNETATTYNTSDSNRVGVNSVAVAQGGDARTGSPACAQGPIQSLATTLEQVAQRNLGIPCIFGTNTDASGTSLDPNEAWGMTTISLGTLATNVAPPAGTGSYFTTNRLLRASFPGGSNTTYWSCLQRTNGGGGLRNCTQIGSGTYTIATLGDARVMTFNNLPAAAQALSSTRVFVERGGAVYYGFKNKVGGTTTRMQFNMAAANALMYQLNLPRIRPADSPKALTGAKATTAATLKGVWGGADANGALIFRFGDNGEFLMADVSAPGGGGRPGLEKGWLDFDPATGQGGRLLEIDSNGEWGTSHPQPGEGLTSITDTAINFTGGSIPRFVDDPNGIVGMWAGGSATDLKAPHFVFFANGKLLSIHPYAETTGPCATARLGPPGIEWSDYTFNAATGALRIFNKIYDTTGCTGLFDSAAAVPNTEANLTLTFAADRKSITVFEAGQPAGTAYRIAPK